MATMDNDWRSAWSTRQRFSVIFQRRPAPEGSLLYTGAYKWTVPLILGWIHLFNMCMIVCGIVLTDTAELEPWAEDPNFRAYQFFFWCGIPSALVLMSLAECVQLYLRRLRPVQIIVTSSISLVACLGFICMIIFANLDNWEITWPDNFFLARVVELGFAALSGLGYVAYLVVASVALSRQNKARKQARKNVGVDDHILERQHSPQRVEVPLEPIAASSSTRPPSYHEGGWPERRERRGSMEKVQEVDSRQLEINGS